MVHLLHDLQSRPYFKYIHTRLIKLVILLTHSCLWLDDFPVSCHAMRSRTCSYGTPLSINSIGCVSYESWKFRCNAQHLHTRLLTGQASHTLGRDCPQVTHALGRDNHSLMNLRSYVALRPLMHSDATTTHWWTWDPTWCTYTHTITRTWCWHHALYSFVV